MSPRHKRILFLLLAPVVLFTLYQMFRGTLPSLSLPSSRSSPVIQGSAPVYETEEELAAYHALDPLCEPVQDAHAPYIQVVDLEPYKEAANDVDILSEKELEAFCRPYSYARLRFYAPGVVRNYKSSCPNDARMRDLDCEWFHMCLWSPEEDEFISTLIHAGTLWEHSNTMHMADVLSKNNNEVSKEQGVHFVPRGLVIDAGANVGQYTLVAALMGYHVLSFEPISQHTEMIAKSLALNGLTDRVTLYRNALADYRNTSTIHFHKSNKGGSTVERLDGQTIKQDPRFMKSVEIEVIRLDDVLPSVLNRFPDLPLIYWKSDIEGFESRMFRGAIKTFAHFQPKHLAFEILGKAFPLTKCKCNALLRAFFDLGYGVTIKGHPKNPILDPSRIEAEAADIEGRKLHFDVFACRSPPCSVRSMNEGT